MFTSANAVALLLWVSLNANPSDPILSLGDRLLQVGSADEAITEYRRYIFFNKDQPDADLGYAYGQIAMAYRSLKRFEDAAEMLRNAIEVESRAELRDKRRIDTGVVEMARGRYDLANSALLKVEMFSQDPAAKRRASFFLGICSLYTADWTEARQAFQSFASDGDSETRSLGLAIDQLVGKMEGKKRKSPAVAKKLSTFLPGLGEIYANDWKGGLKTLAVNAFTGSLVVRDIAGNRFREAVFDSLLLFSRFYSGSRGRAVAAANSHNEKAGLRLIAEILRITDK